MSADGRRADVEVIPLERQGESSGQTADLDDTDDWLDLSTDAADLTPAVPKRTRKRKWYATTVSLLDVPSRPLFS
jgi:hypothetical protein